MGGMTRGPDLDYAGWLVTVGDPKRTRMLERPVCAIETAATYSGAVITIEADVVARAEGLVCVRQEIRGRAPWSAWIPQERATPAARTWLTGWLQGSPDRQETGRAPSQRWCCWRGPSVLRARRDSNPQPSDP